MKNNACDQEAKKELHWKSFTLKAIGCMYGYALYVLILSSANFFVCFSLSWCLSLSKPFISYTNTFFSEWNCTTKIWTRTHEHLLKAYSPIIQVRNLCMCSVFVFKEMNRKVYRVRQSSVHIFFELCVFSIAQKASLSSSFCSLTRSIRWELKHKLWSISFHELKSSFKLAAQHT